VAEYRNRDFIQALRDFRRARIKADIEQLMARLTGKSADLLSYEEVRQRLKAESTARRTLKDIPLDSIVGSVGRYSDFSRSFHPLQDSDQNRWARIETKMVDQTGLPPIEVYQVGEAYFVIDGNHRVSVAREMEASHIEAYVTEVHTKIPLTPDVNPDDIILKERYLKFLERTHLGQLRPGADLTVTVPGQYRTLEKHIELHRYFMSLEQGPEINYEEAVISWYDDVYLVVVQAIRQQNVLRDFPGRTETDLYLWVSGYRALLEDNLEWKFTPELVAPGPLPHTFPKIQNFIGRVIAKISKNTSLGEAEVGPLPGEWRREHLANMLRSQTGRPFRLFTSILVPVDGQEQGWYALNQALGIARREGGRLLGLHVVSTETDKQSPAVQTIKADFNQRCARAGIPGTLATHAGRVSNTICYRARWADLVVLRLIYPPSSQPIAKLSSGLHNIIRRCRTPLLIVPRDYVYPLDRALLAYDGSQKATEALYIATYLANRWQVSLTVISVKGGHTRVDTQSHAQDYLQTQGVQAKFVEKDGPVASSIIETAEENDCNLIIMGGYGHNAVLGLVIGSAVDEVLRTSRRPTLICG
jgi:nucleotide-binding universal stress UspA family protein